MPVNNHTNLFGRRDLLRLGSLGSLGITLDKVLRAGTGKDISCILVWQSGGSSHLDTFDMKPDAPKEIRGEFKPIPTNVPGIQICEHLPYTAKQADKFTILRSMHSRENNHERAINYLLTGYLPLSTLEFPSMGSVISKELGPKNGLPPYVSIPNTFPSYGAGYLGGEYNPFIAGDPNVAGYKVRDLTLPADVDWARVGNRRWLLDKMDAKYRALDANTDFDALDSFQQRAYDLMRSPAAKKAFDIDAEPQALREKYGRTPVGQGALLARRLVEGGVRFVTVAKAWFIALAGAGIPGGRVLGATDKTASEVTDLPVQPEDLLHTIYAILGVDSTREYQTPIGRPSKIVNGGTMIPGLLA